MLNRRNLLASAAVAPLGLALGACSSTSAINSQVPFWAAALKAVATEITSVLPQLQGVGLSGSTLTSVKGILSEIETVLTGIGNASSASQGASTLTIVETYINTLAPLILPFVGLVPGGSVIGLIVAALPAIESALNFLISFLSPAAKEVAATAPQPAGARRGAVAPTPTPEVYLQMLMARASTKASARHRPR